MYRCTLLIREGLTLNAPYPSCHENRTPFPFIHLDEFALRSHTTLDRFIFGGNASNRCKWSATPPIARILTFSFRAMPRMYAHQLFLSIGRDHRHPTLRAEYAMHNVRGIGVAHVLSPLRGLVLHSTLPSASRWANEFRPAGSVRERCEAGPSTHAWIYERICATSASKTFSLYLPGESCATVTQRQC